MKIFARLIILLSILCAPLVLTPAVHAVDVFQGSCSGRGANTAVCNDVREHKDEGNPVVNVIGTVISIFSWVIGVASVIIIIVSGIRFITSQGDPQGIKVAKAAILYAIIGLVVAALAQVIVSVVLTKIG